MSLRAYLSRHRLSISKFARMVGVSRQMVHRWINGTDIPTKKNMDKIIKATNGIVASRADMLRDAYYKEHYLDVL